MRKIYKFIKIFVAKLSLLNLVLLGVVCIISAGMIVSEASQWLAGIAFCASVYGGMRLITYRFGKIPLFMSDKTWNAMSIKHGEEKAEELYREMSLKCATVSYIIAIVALVLALVWEIIVTIYG